MIEIIEMIVNSVNSVIFLGQLNLQHSQTEYSQTALSCHMKHVRSSTQKFCARMRTHEF